MPLGLVVRRSSSSADVHAGQVETHLQQAGARPSCDPAAVARGGEPDPGLVPVVADAEGGGHQVVLPHVDALRRLERQRQHLASRVMRERDGSGPRRLQHDDRQAGSDRGPKPPRSGHGVHLDCPALAIAGCSCGKKTPSPAARRTSAAGTSLPMICAERLPDLDAGHVGNGRQLGPARVVVRRLTSTGAPQLGHVASRPAGGGPAVRAGCTSVEASVIRPTRVPCTSTGCRPARVRSAA